MGEEIINRNSITYVVPFYTAPYDMIKECLYSIISALSGDDRVIVIDDGSAITAEVEAFCRKDKRIIFHANKTNCGVSASRNTAIKLANTKWITFVDSDDIVIADDIKKIKESLTETTDVLSCKIRTVFKGKKYDYNLYEGESINELREEVFKQKSNSSAKKMHIGIAVGKIYSLGFLRKKHIFFNPELKRAEDNVFFLDILSNNPTITKVDSLFYEVRPYSQSTTRRYSSNLYNDFQKTITELYKEAQNDYEKELVDCRNGKYILASIENEFREDNPSSCKEKRKFIKQILNNSNISAIKNYLNNQNNHYKTILGTALCFRLLLLSWTIYEAKKIYNRIRRFS